MEHKPQNGIGMNRGQTKQDNFANILVEANIGLLIMALTKIWHKLKKNISNGVDKF